MEESEGDISTSYSRSRWTDPPKTVKSQSIDIHNPERPRVYSAISSLEESFQAKNYYLMGRSSRPPRNRSPSNGRTSASCSNFLDGDGSRAHSRTQTALADEIISYESTKTASNTSNSDMEQNPCSNVTGILKGKKHEKTTKNKISFDQKESIIQSLEPQPVEMFRPSCDAYTPRMGHKAIKYKPAAERPSVDKMSTSMGTIQR